MTTQHTVTEEQLREFDELGATVLDGPFTSSQLSAASDAIERLHRDGLLGGAGDYLLDADILEIVQHPFMEAVARAALRTSEVEFLTLAARQKDPTPQKPFGHEHEHVDIAYAPADLDAVPRRMLASILVWFSDVTEATGPMTIRPRSHRQLAEHFGRPAPGSENYLGVEHLPKLDYAPLQPILVKAGQVSLLTTAALHSATTNVGDWPRRVLFTVWKPKGLEIAVNMSDHEKRTHYYRELQSAFRPERRHLVPDSVG